MEQAADGTTQVAHRTTHGHGAVGVGNRKSTFGGGHPDDVVKQMDKDKADAAEKKVRCSLYNILSLEHVIRTHDCWLHV
jgi:hypothetical protein